MSRRQLRLGMRGSRPDFLIIGAPKAGSTALHEALAAHPQLYAAPVKEPKYFLTPDRRPDPATQRGPGDAHSAREWIWRRADYERLFAAAPPGTLRFESTPFYLWSQASHPQIARQLPDVKLIAVIRDPVDRAFSNWTHLWADGLEPEADFRTACRLEPQRIAAGWAPFWRYLDLGRYGPCAVAALVGGVFKTGAAQTASWRKQRNRFQAIGLAGAVRPYQHDKIAMRDEARRAIVAELS